MSVNYSTDGMKIQVLDTVLPCVGSGEPRSEGTAHLTPIIRQLGVAVGKLPASYATPVDTLTMPAVESQWDVPLAGEVGFTFERLLEHAYADRLLETVGVRPGEVQRDGIVGSPDGIAFRGETDILTEFKCTWKSLAMEAELGLGRNSDRWWYYLTQHQCYLHMLQMTVCEMFVLFLNGDYKGRKPRLRTYRFEYEPHVLEATWDEVLQFARSTGQV